MLIFVFMFRSSHLYIKIIEISFVEVFDLLKLFSKDSIDEFILCRYNWYDIISSLILLSFGDFLSLFDIKISCDSG